MKRPSIAAWIAHSILLGGFAFSLFFLLILGSGILPIPLTYFAGIALGIGVTFGTISSSVKNWQGIVIRCLCVCVLFCLVGSTFMHFVRSGLLVAESYGTSLAEEIIQTRNERGLWPEAGNNIPKIANSKLNTDQKWPYIYLQHDGEKFSKIGGFLISYRVENKKPVLTISRRDYGVIFNWETRSWVDLNAQRSSETAR